MIDVNDPRNRRAITLIRIIALLFSITVWMLIYRVGEALWKLS